LRYKPKIRHRLERAKNNLTPTKQIFQVATGIPAVQYIAQLLILLPNTLRRTPGVLTVRSIQPHIHNKLIEKANGKFSTTDLLANKIAYESGL